MGEPLSCTDYRMNSSKADGGGRGRTDVDEGGPMWTRADRCGRMRTLDQCGQFLKDASGRRTHPFHPLRGRIRTADDKKIFPGGRKRTADAPPPSASRTDSD